MVGGEGVRKSSLKLRMVGDGGWGEGGGHLVKCGRPPESLNLNFKKWSKFSKTGSLQMLSMSPYLIASYGKNISTVNQLRPVITSIFEG